MDHKEYLESSGKSVKIDYHPEYIPVLSGFTLAEQTPDNVPLPIDDEKAKEKRHFAVEPKQGGCTIDIQTAAKLFMQSKKLAKRSRSKASKAKRYLQKKQAEIDGEMFTNYNLTEMHQKMCKQKQAKIAYLQKVILDQLPKDRTSVKEHITHKINVLEKMRDKTLQQTSSESKHGGSDSGDASSMDSEQIPNRRRRKLRRSVDASSCAVSVPDSEPHTPLNMADIERELAVAKSREKIEDDLDLPFDRLARLTTLRQNVARIDKKFQSLLKGQRGDGDRRSSAKTEEEKLFLAPSRFTKPGMAREHFRRHARIVLIVLKWIQMIMNSNYSFERELKSFVDIATEIQEQAVSTQLEESGLHFDKKYYKANKEISLSQEVRKTLTTRWQWRTEDMVKQALNGLQSLRSLLEYPIATQEKLCKVAWYQTIGAKKAIVRQGHPAESFYFILSGSAIVKKMCRDASGDSRVQVAARLTKGQSFGEIGLLFKTKRTATVESITPMELLVIGRQDFINIFMKSEDPTEDGDHIKFLKQIPCLQNWPFDVLKEESGGCLLHYFKRGSLVTDNDRASEYIYFIKSGTCEVLKKLKAVKPRQPRYMRPKSHPYTDIILPELGMSNNHSKIDSGLSKQNKVVMHADVFREMTEFYESLRRKYGTPGSPTPCINPEPREDTLPTLPKIIVRASTANGQRRPRVAFEDERQQTAPELTSNMPSIEIKLQPIMPVHDRRPVSRAIFNENTPKMTNAHFVVPTTDSMKEKFRPARDNSAESNVTEKDDNVFVRVELLHPKDSFGLNTLKHYNEDKDEVFAVDMGDSPLLALVSKGAEVVMLSKRVFLKYANNKVRLNLRDHIKIYPPERVMQENMQNAADWSVYKEQIVTDVLQTKRKHHRMATVVSASF